LFFRCGPGGLPGAVAGWRLALGGVAWPGFVASRNYEVAAGRGVGKALATAVAPTRAEGKSARDPGSSVKRSRLPSLLQGQGKATARRLAGDGT
jgi:hypothetical protein